MTTRYNVHQVILHTMAQVSIADCGHTLRNSSIIFKVRLMHVIWFDVIVRMNYSLTLTESWKRIRLNQWCQRHITTMPAIIDGLNHDSRVVKHRTIDHHHDGMQILPVLCWPAKYMHQYQHPDFTRSTWRIDDVNSPSINNQAIMHLALNTIGALLNTTWVSS